MRKFQYPVIGEYSFLRDTDLSIELQLIKDCAFDVNINDVTLPQNVMKIGESSFGSIKSLKFNENTEFVIISNNALLYSEIENLTFPSVIVDLEEGWCNGVNKLTKINVPQSNS